MEQSSVNYFHIFPWPCEWPPIWVPFWISRATQLRPLRRRLLEAVWSELEPWWNDIKKRKNWNDGYLVMTNIAMENHHFLIGK
jgi:hypothetical protein